MEGSQGQLAGRPPTRPWALGWANDKAVALPIPLVAPVISATDPVRFVVTVLVAARPEEMV
ncbi:MAG: hypothetical protein WBR28_05085 [Mycobacterium sp.]